MEVTLDLTATAIEVEPADISLEAETEEQPLRRRIIAVSEGIHNGINFRGEEIRRMVQAAVELKEQEGRDYFAAPLVLDYSGRFLDKVGSTYNLIYDEERKAAVADVEFWQFTPMLKEVAERVRRDPENTYFSVRVKGRLREGNEITDLQLINIAVVLGPADSNARIIGELKEDEEGFDMSKSDEVFDFGVVPEHPWKYGKTDKPWRKPALQDFTSSSWKELSNEEKINITGHYTWAPENVITVYPCGRRGIEVLHTHLNRSPLHFT